MMNSFQVQITLHFRQINLLLFHNDNSQTEESKRILLKHELAQYRYVNPQ